MVFNSIGPLIPHSYSHVPKAASAPVDKVLTETRISQIFLGKHRNEIITEPQKVNFTPISLDPQRLEEDIAILREAEETLESVLAELEASDSEPPSLHEQLTSNPHDILDLIENGNIVKDFLEHAEKMGGNTALIAQIKAADCMSDDLELLKVDLQELRALSNADLDQIRDLENKIERLEEWIQRMDKKIAKSTREMTTPVYKTSVTKRRVKSAKVPTNLKVKLTAQGVTYAPTVAKTLWTFASTVANAAGAVLDSIGSGFKIIYSSFNLYHKQHAAKTHKAWMTRFSSSPLITKEEQPSRETAKNQLRTGQRHHDIESLLEKRRKSDEQAMNTHRKVFDQWIDGVQNTAADWPEVLLRLREKEIDLNAVSEGAPVSSVEELRQLLKTPTLHDKLLRQYASYKGSMPIATMNALKAMALKKQQIERRFFKFRLKEARISFGVSMGSTALMIALKVMALGCAIAIPTIALAASGIGAAALTVAIAGIGLFLFHKYKPNLLKTYMQGVQARIFLFSIPRFFINLVKRWKISKMKTLCARVDKIQKEIGSPKTEKIEHYLEKIKKLGGQASRIQEKVDVWRAKIHILKQRQKRAELADFSRFIYQEFSFWIDQTLAKTTLWESTEGEKGMKAYLAERGVNLDKMDPQKFPGVAQVKSVAEFKDLLTDPKFAKEICRQYQNQDHIFASLADGILESETDQDMERALLDFGIDIKELRAKYLNEAKLKKEVVAILEGFFVMSDGDIMKFIKRHANK